MTPIQRALAYRAGYIARLVAVSKTWCPFCSNRVELHPAFCWRESDNDEAEWKDEAALVVQEALELHNECPLDATRAELAAVYGTPARHARAFSGAHGFPSSTLPDWNRRCIVAHWYRWQVAS